MCKTDYEEEGGGVKMYQKLITLYVNDPLCFVLNSKPYLSCFADYRGVSCPPCPVLFGFYETRDVFFETLADSDGLVLQRRGHEQK